MISRIAGTLTPLEADRAHVAMSGGVTLDVLLPAFTLARLGGQVGQDVELHTLLFLESQNQGATLTPCLAGFLTPQDRAFYQLFITCKGIGHRKALRALALPPAQIAAAVADRDVSLLQSLPEVGKRTAETIAATLRGKVDAFITEAAYPAGPREATAAPGTDEQPAASPQSNGRLAREALEVLLQLGETRADAVAWIDRVLASDNPPSGTEQLIAEVYRLKAAN